MTAWSEAKAQDRRLEEASAWCLRFADGPLPPGEQDAFDLWLDADPENMPAFERSVKVWRRFGEVAAEPEFINVRERALVTFRRNNQTRWRSTTKSWRRYASIAACLMTIIIGGALWVETWPDQYETRVGERRVVQLEDGSSISLDAETRVEARLRKNSRELVLLAGRAKFDVAKDPFRPFSVSAGNKVVVAIGTSFSVELVRKQMRVVLYEGKVSVLDHKIASAKPVPLKLKSVARNADQLLKPGSELVADLAQSTATVKTADISKSLSWEAGHLVFIDEPLLDAVERVNRYSNHKVRLANERVARLRFDGVFNAGDVDAFVIGVKETLPIDSVHDAGVITLKSKD